MKKIVNKIHIIILFLLVFVPIIVTFISLVFMPEQVPLHANLNGEIDRYGSKYEILILPLIILVFGAIFYFWAKHTSDLSERILIWGANFAEIIFNVINYILIAQGLHSEYNYFPVASQIAFSMSGLVFIIIGFALLAINLTNRARFGNMRYLVINNLSIGILIIIFNFLPLSIMAINVISAVLLVSYLIITVVFFIRKTHVKRK